MRLSIHHILLLAFPVFTSLGQDSSSYREIRPGIVHTEYAREGPYTLDVVSVELSNRNVSIESYRPDSLTTTTRQVLMREMSGEKVIAAVNADFFSFKTHWPVGNQISRGIPVTGLRTARSHISLTDDGVVRIGPASFSASAFWGGREIAVDGLNTHEADGKAFLFTGFWGESTRTSQDRTDVELRMLSQGWTIGDTLTFQVGSVAKDGNASLTYVDAVLSFEDGLAEFQNNDTVRVVIRYGEHVGSIRTMVGGAGRILVDGEIPSDGNGEAESIGQRFITDRHPRTFVAINKDTSTMFLCTVDGRQPASVGMDFKEMGQFLLSIGAWNAVNLDGGGSTTMVVGGTIVNSPSDKTGERPVANTLMVVEKIEIRKR